MKKVLACIVLLSCCIELCGASNSHDPTVEAGSLFCSACQTKLPLNTYSPSSVKITYVECDISELDQKQKKSVNKSFSSSSELEYEGEISLIKERLKSVSSRVMALEEGESREGYCNCEQSVPSLQKQMNHLEKMITGYVDLFEKSQSQLLAQQKWMYLELQELKKQKRKCDPAYDSE